jgi:hypothetical protein
VAVLVLGGAALCIVTCNSPTIPPYLIPGIGSGGNLALEDYSTATAISTLEQTPLDVRTLLKLHVPHGNFK